MMEISFAPRIFYMIFKNRLYEFTPSLRIWQWISGIPWVGNCMISIVRTYFRFGYYPKFLHHFPRIGMALVPIMVILSPFSLALPIIVVLLAMIVLVVYWWRYISNLEDICRTCGHGDSQHSISLLFFVFPYCERCLTECQYMSTKHPY